MDQLCIGIDIVEVDTIKKLMQISGPAFFARTFSVQEIEACEGRKSAKHQCLSARLAAKEAFMKALGTGWSKKIQWKHIEVLNKPGGEPFILLTKRAEQLFLEKGLTHISLSISHTAHMAVACVILR
jgi:holo-[acyl-carrier protein] synthase